MCDSSDQLVLQSCQLAVLGDVLPLDRTCTSRCRLPPNRRVVRNAWQGEVVRVRHRTVDRVVGHRPVAFSSQRFAGLAGSRPVG